MSGISYAVSSNAVLSMEEDSSQETFDLCNSTIRDFVDAKDDKTAFNLLSSHSEAKELLDYSNFPTISFKKSNHVPFKLVISKTDDYSMFESYELYDNNFVFEKAIPGEQYFWKVTDNEDLSLGEDSFIVKNAPTRYLNIDGGSNIRDIGGWTNEDGFMLKYEYIYRGAMLNGYNNGSKLTGKGISQFRDVYNIKTEIDLRNKNDDAGQDHCYFANKEFGQYDRNYLKASINQYDRIFGSTSDKNSFNKIFECLGNRNNYPVYFHCNAGADRTGTLAFLINGYLGVSYENLTKDFELTSFSKQGNRWRSAPNSDNSGFDDTGIYQNNSSNYVAWGVLYREMMSKYATEDNKLSSAIENYLVNICNVKIEWLQTLKVVMLGLEKVEDERNVNETCSTDGVGVYKYKNETFVLNIPATGHHFEIDDDKAVCPNCNTELILEEKETAVRGGFGLGIDVEEAFTINNTKLMINVDGVAKFNNEDAGLDTHFIIARYKDNSYKCFKATIYSALIKNEAALRTMNQYTFEKDGATYGYFKLMNDIKCSSVWTNEQSIAKNSLRNNCSGFKGVFDGNNMTINNFNTISRNSSLIYVMGSGGVVKNLNINGLIGETSKYISAYTYGGAFENINISVSISAGGAGENSSCLLGSVGFNNLLANVIYIENISLENKGDFDIGFSSAIGQLFQNDGKVLPISGNLLINNLSVKGFDNLLVNYNQNKGYYYGVKTISELIDVVGENNIANVFVER